MELNNVGMCSLCCNLTHFYHLPPICKSDMQLQWACPSSTPSIPDFLAHLSHEYLITFVWRPSVNIFKFFMAFQNSWVQLYSANETKDSLTSVDRFYSTRHKQQSVKYNHPSPRVCRSLSYLYGLKPGKIILDQSKLTLTFELEYTLATNSCHQQHQYRVYMIILHHWE